MKTSVKKKRQSSIVHRPFRGFTLVELTAAAALTALLTSVAFITYAQTWKQWALRQNAQQFYLAARYARVLAIESRRPCQLMIDTDGKTYFIVQEGEEAGQAARVSSLWHRPTRLDDAVSFERVLVTQSTVSDVAEGVTFRPDGSADAALIQLSNGERVYTVQISAATARATLFSSAMEEYQPDQIDLDEVQ